MTKRLRSDGRWARKTASLLLTFEDEPIRWKAGLHELILKSLETPSLGGPIGVELDEIALGGQLANHAVAFVPTGDGISFNGKNMVVFKGYSLNNVMGYWNTLPPDERQRVEIIMGQILDDEQLHLGMKHLFQISTDSTSTSEIIPAFSTKLDAVSTIEGQKLLEKSILLADSTGFLGKEWQDTVAAEMARRGKPINSTSPLDIQLELIHRDKNTMRRDVWRSLIVEQLNKGSIGTFQKVFEKMGMLSPDELGGLTVDVQIEFLKASFAENRTSVLWNSEASMHQDVLNSLNSYIPILSATSVAKLLRRAPTHVWIQHAPEMVNLYFKNILKYYPSDTSTLVRAILSSRARQFEVSVDGMLYDAMVETQVAVPAELFDNILDLKLQVQTKSQMIGLFSDQETTTVEYNLQAFGALNWSESNEMFLQLARRKSGSKETRDELVPYLKYHLQMKHSSSADKDNRTFLSFLRSLEEVWPSQVTPSKQLTTLLSKYGGTDSLWFHAIMKSKNGSDIRRLLLDVDVELDQLSHQNIKRINTHRRRLKGWPNPLKKVRGFENRDRTMAKLALKPNAFQRLHRIAGITAGIISLIVLLAWVNTTGWLAYEIPLVNLVDDATADYDSRIIFGIKAFCLALFIGYRLRLRQIRIVR